jgi:hypothetical protein
VRPIGGTRIVETLARVEAERTFVTPPRKPESQATGGHEKEVEQEEEPCPPPPSEQLPPPPPLPPGSTADSCFTDGPAQPHHEQLLLLTDLLRVLVVHRERLVSRQEPLGYGTVWWTGHVDEGEEEEVRRRREDQQLSRYGERPTEALRVAEEERRKGIATQALQQTLDSVAMLRARSDLLTHRLPLIDSHEDSALRKLSEVIAATPLAGGLDLHPSALGVATGPWYTSSSLDPQALSMQMRQVEQIGDVASAVETRHHHLTVLGVPPLRSLPSANAKPNARLMHDGGAFPELSRWSFAGLHSTPPQPMPQPCPPPHRARPQSPPPIPSIPWEPPLDEGVPEYHRRQPDTKRCES